MSDYTTTARPYAKAIFQHALALKQLKAWSTNLQNLAAAVLDARAKQFIGNPATTAQEKTELLMAIFARQKQTEDRTSLESLVELLANNKRLLILPDVYAQYEVLRAEQEKTLAVHVSSFATLTSTQQHQLIASLSNRLQRQVTLEMEIDESLLGGAVIRAGDLVIDGSVRGKLNKLGATLAA